MSSKNSCIRPFCLQHFWHCMNNNVYPFRTTVANGSSITEVYDKTSMRQFIQSEACFKTGTVVCEWFGPVFISISLKYKLHLMDSISVFQHDPVNGQRSLHMWWSIHWALIKAKVLSRLSKFTSCNYPVCVWPPIVTRHLLWVSSVSQYDLMLTRWIVSIALIWSLTNALGIRIIS